MSRSLGTRIKELEKGKEEVKPFDLLSIQEDWVKEEFRRATVNGVIDYSRVSPEALHELERDLRA